MFGALAIPLLLSFGNITMRKMKGMHEDTVSLYINPTLAILMYFYVRSLGMDLQIFKEFHLSDWLFTIQISAGVVLVQTLKFIAL